MENKELLNEERYQKTNKGLFFAGFGLIILGVIVFMVMFIPKILSNTKVNKEQLKQQLEELKPQLESRYNELKAKGITESWDYKDKEGYEMEQINNALDPSLSTCESISTYSDHETTHEYCKIKAQIHDADSSFSNGRIMFSLVPALMILMPCLAIGGMLILTSKRRNITAYYMQQTMPVAQEGMEKMAPTIGKVGATVAKEMAPVYGEIAKEIGKGIKEGIKDEDSKCPECGRDVKKDAKFCDNCGKKI